MSLPAGIRHYSEELRIKTCGRAEKETHKEQEAPLPQELKRKSSHVRVRGLTSAKYVSGVSISIPPPSEHPKSFGNTKRMTPDKTAAHGH